MLTEEEIAIVEEKMSEKKINYPDFSFSISSYSMENNNRVKINFVKSTNEKLIDDYYEKINLSTDSEKPIILLDCIVQKKCSTDIEVLCKTIIYGNLQSNYTQIKTNIVTFVIDFDPTPLGLYLKKEICIIDDLQVSIEIKKADKDLNALNIEIKSLYDNKDLDFFETIFFDFLDIIFLCFGSYPYIKNEKIIENNNTITIIKLQKNIYQKEGSFSHRNNIIASNLALTTSLKKIQDLKKNNDIVILMLEQSTHAEGVLLQVLLTFLLQSVEGFVRETRQSETEKFSKELKQKIVKSISSNENYLELLKSNNLSTVRDSIRGLLGKINQSSFKECILLALNTNETTKLIFKNELSDEKKQKAFLDKVSGTRNQFSHCSKESKCFIDNEETVEFKNKFELLLRILLLQYIGIDVAIEDALSIIEGINQISVY